MGKKTINIQDPGSVEPSNLESLSTSRRSSTVKKDVPVAKDPLNFSKPSYIASIAKFREVMRSNNFKFSEILDVVPNEPTAEMVDGKIYADMIKEILDDLRNQVIVIGLIPYLVKHNEDDLLAVLPKEAVVFLWYKLKKMNMDTLGKLNLKGKHAKSSNEDYIDYATKFIYFSGMPAEGRRLLRNPFESLSRLSMQSSLKENKTAVGGFVDRKMVQLNFDLSTCHFLQNYAKKHQALATNFSRKLEAALEILANLMLERMKVNANQENLKIRTLCKEYKSARNIEELQKKLEKQEMAGQEKINRVQAKVDGAKARRENYRKIVNESNEEVMIVSEATMKLDSVLGCIKTVKLEKMMLDVQEKYEQLVAQHFDQESVLRSGQQKLREKMIVLLGRVDRNMIEREEELERSNASLNIINSQYFELQQLLKEQESKYLQCVSEMSRFGVSESDVLCKYTPEKPSEARERSVQFSDSSKMGSNDLSSYTARSSFLKY